MAVSNKPFQIISHICFIAGMLSILGSIALWLFYESATPAASERLAIFVGLWAPTFFILSGRFATQTVVNRLPDSPTREPAGRVATA